MKHEKEKTTTSTVTIYECYFCDMHSDTKRVCFGCGKNMCGKCVNYIENDCFTGQYLGDYAWQVCDLCSKIMTPYENDAKEILDTAEWQVEEIKKMWQQKCREDKGNQS